MIGDFVLRAALSGVLVAIVSLVARKVPPLGGLIASIPLVSTLAMIWLWRDSGDTARVADYAMSTFAFFLPSVPMFLIIPVMLRGGAGFWTALGTGIGVTMLLYLLTAFIIARLGITF